MGVVVYIFDVFMYEFDGFVVDVVCWLLDCGDVD